MGKLILRYSAFTIVAPVLILLFISARAAEQEILYNAFKGIEKATSLKVELKDPFINFDRRFEISEMRFLRGAETVARASGISGNYLGDSVDILIDNLSLAADKRFIEQFRPPDDGTGGKKKKRRQKKTIRAYVRGIECLVDNDDIFTQNQSFTLKGTNVDIVGKSIRSLSSELVWGDATFDITVRRPDNDTTIVAFKCQNISISQLLAIRQAYDYLKARKLGVSGNCAVSGEIELYKWKVARYMITLNPRGCEITSSAYSATITGVSGFIEVTKDKITAETIRGNFNGGAVSLSGSYDLTNESGEASLLFERLRLNNELLLKMPDKFHNTLKDFSLDVNTAGLIKLTLGAEARASGAITILDGTASYVPVPVPIKQARGDITFSAAKGSYEVTINSLSGQVEKDISLHEENKVSLHGLVKNDSVKIAIDFLNFALDGGFYKQLTPQLKEVFEDLGLGAAGNLQVEVESKNEETSFTAFMRAYSFALRKAHIDKGSGLLWANGILDKGKLSIMTGSLYLNSVFIDKYELREASSYFEYSGSENKVTISEFRASGYQGMLKAHVTYFPKEQKIKASAYLNDIDVGNFLRSARKSDSKMFKAKLSLSIDDLAYDLKAKTAFGSGNIRLTDIDFGEIPTIAKILTAIFSVDLPTSNISVYKYGSANFRLTGDKFFCKSYIIANDSLSLYGYGWIDFDGNIELRVKDERTRFRGIFAILFPVDIIINEFQKATRAFAVTGKLKKPNVSIMAIPSLHKDPAWLED